MSAKSPSHPSTENAIEEGLVLMQASSGDQFLDFTGRQLPIQFQRTQGRK